MLPTISIFLDGLGVSGWQAICKTLEYETVLPRYRASTPVFSAPSGQFCCHGGKKA